MENLASITDKIQKLWAQATDKGVSENEAALFTAKVHELLARYNLDLSVVEQTGGENECVEEIVQEGRKLSQWQTALATEIARLCLSECFFLSARRGTKQLVFIGTRGNVAMAKALLSHLLEAIRRIRKEEKKECGMISNARWGHSFDLGCSSRLRGRIQELIAERKAGVSAELTASESTALVVVAEQELAKARTAMEQAHPSMRTTIVRSRYSDQSGFSAGYRAGATISLNNQIQ